MEPTKQKLGHHATVAIKEAQSSLSRPVHLDQPTILLRNNRPAGAVLSIARFNEYETLQAAFAKPRLLKDLIDAADSAHGVPLTELGNERDLRDFLVARSTHPEHFPAIAQGEVAACRAKSDSRRTGPRRG